MTQVTRGHVETALAPLVDTLKPPPTAVLENGVGAAELMLSAVTAGAQTSAAMAAKRPVSGRKRKANISILRLPNLTQCCRLRTWAEAVWQQSVRLGLRGGGWGQCLSWPLPSTNPGTVGAPSDTPSRGQPLSAQPVPRCPRCSPKQQAQILLSPSLSLDGVNSSKK